AARLSATEKDLSAQSETLRAALQKDGSVAFTFALEHCRDDLRSASDLLADEQTGYLVQSVQGDVHQRLLDLLAVLDAEQERRREAKMEPPKEGEDQQQQKTPLVPTVAELLLIQRMEQAALARLQNFQRAHPALDEADGTDPVERELLGRWALEHAAVTELFRKMIPAGGPAAPPDGAAPGGPPEGGGGEDEGPGPGGHGPGGDGSGGDKP
ncbi:MAG TPA: hypothetical protein VK824_09725, partial [Planctomycetota bacterium]|nr:hypothetical protein [Planctomycetota bacterium]